jgi:hypothetical protein
MASKPKVEEDPRLANPAVLKELVAVAVQLHALDRTIDELRARVEANGETQRLRIAVMAATLDAGEFLTRLVRMQIAVENEGEE